MRASLILATSDQAPELEIILTALLTQTERDFEVILADDGSADGTKELVARMRPQLFFPVTHVWQPRRGYRKVPVLNAALREAKGEVFVFLDGDCAPHSEYIAQHLRLSEHGYFVAGRRVDLSKEMTARISAAEVARGQLNGRFDFLWKLFWDCQRKGGSTPFHRAYMVKNPLIRKICGLERVVDMKGCNFSAFADDVRKVNGFDARYSGYGREDTDLEIRFLNSGLKIRSAKNLCVQFHLWHPQRVFSASNNNFLDEARRSGRVRAEQGMYEIPPVEPPIVLSGELG